MDIPEEDAAQLAKRKEIQAIMRDASIAPQEKQKRVQQVIARAAPRPESTNGVSQSPTGLGKEDVKNSAKDPERQNGVGEKQTSEGERGLAQPSATSTQAIMSDGSLSQQPTMAPGSIPERDERAPSQPVEKPEPAGLTRTQIIQALMRDTSIPPAEKQKRIQQIMASGGLPQEQSSPETQDDSGLLLAPKASNTSPTPTPEPTASKEMIQAILRDTSLTAQERQQKIQHAMASGGAPSRDDSPPSAPRSEPVPAAGPTPPAASSRSQAIQALMRDPSIPPQEKQRRIQQIMASTSLPQQQASSPPEALGETAPSSSPAAPSAVSAPSPSAAASRKAIQAIMQDSSLTPQQRQQKIQQAMASGGTQGSQTTSDVSRFPAKAASQTDAAGVPPVGAVAATGGSQTGKMRATRPSSQPLPAGIAQIESDAIEKAQLPSTGAAVPGAVFTTGGDRTGKSRTSSIATDRGRLRQVEDETTTVSSLGNSVSTSQPSPPVAINQIEADAIIKAGASPPAQASQPGAVPTTGGNRAGKSPRQIQSVTAADRLRQLESEALNRSGGPDDPATRKIAQNSAPAVPPASQRLHELESEALNRAGAPAEDPAARKIAQDAAPATSAPTLASQRLRELENEALNRAGSSAEDPAARKIAQNSAPASSTPTAASQRLRQLENEALNRAGSSAEDPAASKIAQDSSTLPSQSPSQAAVASSHASASFATNTVANIDRDTSGSGDPNFFGMNRARQFEAEILGKNAVIQSPPQRHEDSDVTVQETVVSDDGPGIVSEAPVPLPHSQPPPPTEMPTPEVLPVEQPPTPEVASQREPIDEPEYAGLRYDPTDIAGGEDGGIQAFVADQTVEALGVTMVPNEEEEAKEEQRKERKVLRWGICVVILLIVVIVVPTVLTRAKGPEEVVVPRDPTASPSQAPSASPSSSPTSDNFAKLQESIRELYGDDGSFEKVFQNFSSPQYKAALWAANYDVLQLQASDPRMLTRYILAAFYFSTNGDGWIKCGRNSTTCDERREWLSGSNECSWYMITCIDPPNDNTVTTLFVPPSGREGNKIVGSLPDDLAFLSDLQTLILSTQTLTGTIPEIWSRWSNLETIIISNNRLTGTFPEFLLKNNPLIGTIQIGRNMLGGSLPSSLSSPSLTTLNLGQNVFTGVIPSQMDLPALRTLGLGDNRLQGPLPSELFTQLPNLTRLSLNDNQFVGTLPDTIGGVAKALELRLQNTMLGGPLPSALFELLELKELDLSGSNYTGTISESFSRLTKISEILLHNNSFTGPIPSGLESLTRLQQLKLHLNNLTGTISQALCDRKGNTFFDLQNLTLDCDEVECGCCDICF